MLINILQVVCNALPANFIINMLRKYIFVYMNKEIEVISDSIKNAKKQVPTLAKLKKVIEL